MNLSDIAKMLMINKHRLDDELEVQAEIQWRISETASAARARADKAKDALSAMEARISSDIIDDDPKLGVAKVTAKVKIHPDRAAAFAKYQTAETEARDWDGMFLAWKAKGYSLSSLCDLYAANYFANDGHTARDVRVGGGKQDYERQRGEAAVRRQQTTTPAESSAPVVRRRTLE